jgi:hypothetical protein
MILLDMAKSGRESGSTDPIRNCARVEKERDSGTTSG